MWDAQLVGTHSINCYFLGLDRPTILRDVMSDAGMTQSCLSALSGVKQSSLSQMLHGRIDMSDDMMR